MAATSRSDFRDDQGALLGASLSRMDARSWDVQVDEYQRARRREARRRRRERKRLAKAGLLVAPTLLDEYVRDDPGDPLGGHGTPLGHSLRVDGESHRTAWMRILRADPCAYCDGRSDSVDHIEPKSRSVSGIGGAHCWTNFTGACGRCNESKAAKSMLPWMLARAGQRG